MAEPAISIKFDTSQLQKVDFLLRGIGKNVAQRARDRAINRTLAGVKTDSVNEVRKKITPKAKVIRKHFKDTKAYQGSVAKITCTGSKLPLIEFRARPTLKGVTVQIEQGKGRELWPSAFIAKVKAGKPKGGVQTYHEGVFMRRYDEGPAKPMRPGFTKRSDYGVLPKKYRLPIDQLFGPRVPDIFAEPTVMSQVMAKASVRLDKAISQQINYELGRL